MVGMALAALSVAQGVMGKINGDANAANARAAGAYNAAQSRATGKVNAENAKTLSEYNAKNVIADGDRDAQLVRTIADFNSDMQVNLNDFNNHLLDQDIGLLWEELDLDLRQYSMEAVEALNKSQLKYMASGTLLGKGDSLDQALIDEKTKFDVDKLIMRNNADISMRKLQDSQAKGNYETDLAVSELQFNGEVNAFKTLTSAESRAKQITMQGDIDSANASWEGETGAANAVYSGDLDAFSATQQGNSALINGAMKAGAGLYGANKSTTTKDD